jgi:hypothetical protein
MRIADSTFSCGVPPRGYVTRPQKQPEQKNPSQEFFDVD